MAFKPQNAGKPAGAGFEGGNFPTPRAGSRKARISLIVDMGVQEREDFEDPNTGEVKEQKPCQQVAVFADLVADVVDYGGNIGKKQYRLMLNKSFQGVIQGINFTATPPKDAKGNTIPNKPWGFHPANLLTKIAKAVGKPEVIESMDVEQLLGLPFMAQVEVKETEGKKKDAEGNPIIYKNVNYKGAAEVPEDDDGNPLPVAELTEPALCVTFDNAKPEHIKFLRQNLIAQIKKANNYEGSKMQKAIEAFEAANAAGSDDDNGSDDNQDDDTPAEKPAAKTKPKATAKPKAKASAPAPTDDGDDSDVPF